MTSFYINYILYPNSDLSIHDHIIKARVFNKLRHCLSHRGAIALRLALITQFSLKVFHLRLICTSTALSWTKSYLLNHQGYSAESLKPSPSLLLYGANGLCIMSSVLLKPHTPIEELIQIW